MEISKISSDVLSDTTLRALIRLLDMKGYDLDKILEQYKNEIYGSKLSGSTYKIHTHEHLSSLIQEMTQ